MKAIVTASVILARESFRMSSLPLDKVTGLAAGAAVGAVPGGDDSCALAGVAKPSHATNAAVTLAAAVKHRIFIRSAFPYAHIICELRPRVKLGVFQL